MGSIKKRWEFFGHRGLFERGIMVGRGARWLGIKVEGKMEGVKPTPTQKKRGSPPDPPPPTRANPPPPHPPHRWGVLKGGGGVFSVSVFWWVFCWGVCK